MVADLFARSPPVAGNLDRHLSPSGPALCQPILAVGALDSRAAFMTPADALRYLDHEARSCRDHDAHEALCLLMPALMRLLELPPMDDYEALTFRGELHDAIHEASTPANTHSTHLGRR